eukprot:CAMPEP_0197041556 /NCGR_PEP_ID=MMETSP1384-20130603/18083_1 /TAXON_ID=29189 /ORGANISM="Ammonia sp." /LENGTH=769 /DNA_ID=CAMNT_0042472505 /DNA_START=59 /DNA_END=2368 /DNA_ORIENTATION=-
MNVEKLKRAFNKSDFDGDGHLNEFETNHFGYLLFGHKNQAELYHEMCTLCDSSPLFGLSFQNILHLFPTAKQLDDDDKDDKDDDVNMNSSDDEKQYKKKNKSKKRHKKKSKKKKKKKKKKQAAPHKQASDEQPPPQSQLQQYPSQDSYPAHPPQAMQAASMMSHGLQPDTDDLDVDNWADLPPSDDEREEEENPHQLQLQKDADAQSNLNHIRTISAFVMSGLKDSSDSSSERDANAPHKQTQQADESGKQQSTQLDDDEDDGDGNNTFREMQDEHERREQQNDNEEIFALKQEIMQWKDKFSELEQNKSNMHDRYKKLQKQYVNLQNEHDVKIKQYELQKLNDVEITLKDTEHKEELEMHTKKIERLSQERKELMEKNSKLNTEISEMTENIDNLNELCETYTESITSYKQQIESMEQEKNSYIAQIEELQTAVSDQEELNEQVEALKKYNAEWKDKYIKMNEELQQIETEKLTLNNKISEYEKQLTNVVSLGDYHELEIKHKNMQIELGELQQVMRKGNTDNVENISKISVLNTKLQQMEAQLAAERQNNEQRVQSNEKEKEIEIKRVKIEYESKLSQSSMKIDELNDQIERLKKQMAQQHTSIQSLTSQKQSMQQQMESLKAAQKAHANAKPAATSTAAQAHHSKTESSKMVDLLINDVHNENAKNSGFDFDFFATTNIQPTMQATQENLHAESLEEVMNNYEENEDNYDENDGFDLSQFTTNYQAPEDEHENEQVAISDIDGLSAKQKFLLMKARMASQNEDGDD